MSKDEKIAALRDVLERVLNDERMAWGRARVLLDETAPCGPGPATVVDSGATEPARAEEEK